LLRTRFLKAIFLGALALAVALLVYLATVLHPAYETLLIENAEDEASRFSTYLVTAYHLDNPAQPLERGSIPAHIAEEVGRLQADEELVKLRIFSSRGEIIFSSLPKEIGTLNTYPYFHEQVAKGEFYSKTVEKDSVTAEMEIVKRDVVETYIPIMVNDHFHGAIETYYDVTDSYRNIGTLTRHSLFVLGSVASALLALLYFALNQADKSLQGRQKAEKELRLTNDRLEQRVAERAGELLRVNESLTNEIAERTLTQMALSGALSDMQESREKLQAILTSVSDGLLVIDDGRISIINQAAATILQTSVTDATGKKLVEIVASPIVAQALGRLVTSRDEDEDQIDLEYPPRPGTRPRTYQVRRSILSNEHGIVYGAILLLQDVTHAREVEQMKSDFLNMAAHELSTPLATIIGYTELLTGEHGDQLTLPQKEEALTYINNKAEALSRIVDDLLDVSRIEAGKGISIVCAPFDYCASMRRLMTAYRDAYPTYRFALDCQLENSEIVADQVRIDQILENLLSNAVKYTPAGGEIRIVSSEQGEAIQIKVIDGGIGMTAEQVEHVFDKFYRADTSDTARPGVGLGMSIARHIIEAHGGTIKVDSTPGKGTTVTIQLPRNSATS
jgi:signal transduction histidine kinase